jgi:hypothetical protein
MKLTSEQRIAQMSFASVYPHYVTKVERKGRSVQELHEVIFWLTGFSEKELQSIIADKSTFTEFFSRAKLHPNASLITGSICGYKIQEIQDPLMRKVRYLDKLVDELAKGKALDKILRK